MTLNSTENLFDAVLSRENLNAAWERVRSNKGVAGIDGITIDDFVAYFKGIGQSLVQAIRTGDYQPYPVNASIFANPMAASERLGYPRFLIV